MPHIWFWLTINPLEFTKKHRPNNIKENQEMGKFDTFLCISLVDIYRIWLTGLISPSQERPVTPWSSDPLVPLLAHHPIHLSVTCHSSRTPTLQALMDSVWQEIVPSRRGEFCQDHQLLWLHKSQHHTQGLSGLILTNVDCLYY